MEQNTNEAVAIPVEFKAPTKKEDFLTGENTIKHTYDNGNSVAFVLLSDGTIAKIREGNGFDVEKATIEAGGNQSKYMSSMMASTVTVDGKAVNMFDLGARRMKDYMRIQAAFVDVNF